MMERNRGKRDEKLVFIQRNQSEGPVPSGHFPPVPFLVAMLQISLQQNKSFPCLT